MVFVFGLVILFTGCVFAEEDVQVTEGYDPKVFYNADLFEGDIKGSLPTEAMNAINNRAYLWPQNTMVYQISPQLYGIRGVIGQAMNHITQATGGCIRFRERNGNDRDFVYMMADQGCYSLVGRNGNQQPLSLGQGCGVVGVVIHEIMHALGFHHHHSRSDRDQFLEIVWGNIPYDMRPQFTKLSPGQDQLFTQFDYGSIMMYGRAAFSSNGGDTMRPRGGQQILDPGYKSGMTQADAYAIKSLYGCQAGK
jgi:hypothetical protein